MSQTANCPWPPDCLTCRPWPLAGPANVSRSDTRSGTESTCDAVPAGQPVEQHVDVRLAHASTAPAGGSPGCSPAAASGPRRPAAAGPATACPRRTWSRRRSRPAAAARASPTARSAPGRPCRTGCRRSRRGRAWRPRQMSPATHSVDRSAGSRRAGWTARRPARRRRGPRGRGRGRAPDEPVEVAGDVHGRVGPQRAGEHPDQAEPPDVRVGRRLDHLGDQRAGRVAGERRLGRPVRACVTAGSGCSSGDGKRLGEDLQHLGDADARAGPQRRAPGRSEPRATAFSRSAIEHVDVDVLAGEVAVHQGLVLGLRDDPLDQRVARGPAISVEVLGPRASRATREPPE